VSLRDQLQAVYDEHSRLTPQLVVDAARPADHPLHDRFEWDDKTAAEAHRLDQARRLIRSVRVIYREANEKEAARTVRAFHSIRDEQGTAYRPLEEVTESPLLSKLLLQDMEREWKQLMRRYGHFEEFLQMVRGDLEEKAA
jgi:hypothetical protein